MVPVVVVVFLRVILAMLLILAMLILSLCVLVTLVSVGPTTMKRSGFVAVIPPTPSVSSGVPVVLIEVDRLPVVRRLRVRLDVRRRDVDVDVGDGRGRGRRLTGDDGRLRLRIDVSDGLPGVRRNVPGAKTANGPQRNACDSSIGE